jgi:hypothetical protein
LILIGVIGVGSALLLAAVWISDPGLFFFLFLIIPPLLGIFAAEQAAQRVSLLALAIVMFAAGATAVWFALDPGLRAEGGAALIVLWLIPAELICLLVTNTVIRISHRRKRARGIPERDWTTYRTL